MLDGNVALVTGASRGIGRAITTRLHEEGMHVAIIARSEDTLREVERELSADGRPGRVLALSADVTDPASVARVVATTEEELGGIDLLVNNAGVAESQERTLWDADVDAWWHVITTNLRGPMLFAYAVVPRMKQRNSGRIINVNSLRGVHPLPTQTAYGVSKFGLAKMTEILAASLADTEVRVFDYSPGRVLTDLTRSLGSLAGVPDSSWTSIDTAVDGLLAIARGQLDGLSGRFIHAADDPQELSSRTEEVVRRGGRMMTLAEGYPGDPLSRRAVGR